MTLEHEQKMGGRSGNGVGEYVGNIATIYPEAVYHAFKSKEEGKPCYVDVDFIKIKTLGHLQSEVVRELTEDDKIHYPDVWEAYSKQQNVETSGTSLSELPGVRKSRILELQAKGVRTIESLAAISDTNASKMGMDVIAIKRQAEKWLGGSDEEKIDTLDQENKKLRADNERLAEEVESLKGEGVNLLNDAETAKSKYNELTEKYQTLSVKYGEVSEKLLTVSTGKDTMQDEVEAKAANPAKKRRGRPPKNVTPDNNPERT